MSAAEDERLQRLLAERIYAGSDYKPFGRMTASEVEARAEELRGATGFGPTQRVASVAAAWEGLAQAMRRAGAEAVEDLDRRELLARVDRLWVVPPGGSLL